MARPIRTKPNSNNTSGHVGVNWSEEKSKWHSKLGHRNKRIHLGYFENLSDAVQAYKNGVKKYKLREVVE